MAQRREGDQDLRPGADPDSAPGTPRAPTAPVAELTDKAHSLPALLTPQKPTWAGLGEGNPGEEERRGCRQGDLQHCLCGFPGAWDKLGPLGRGGREHGVLGVLVRRARSEASRGQNASIRTREGAPSPQGSALSDPSPFLELSQQWEETPGALQRPLRAWASLESRGR